jgi:hypothetical protein
MKYEGYHFTRVIYLCPNCGAVMKVAKERTFTGGPAPMALLRETE